MLSIAGLFVLQGCAEKSNDPFDSIHYTPYDKEFTARLKGYINSSFDSAQVKSKQGNPALYLDFSSGINKAIGVPDVNSLITHCYNAILTQNFDVFQLGMQKVTPIAISNPTQLGQKISSASAYSDIYAPIQVAVEQIVQSKNDALLITDFEEWQNNKEITNTAYLKIPFKKWLSEGNSIHFFIADYVENKANKHIYFTVFSYGPVDENSMLTKLEKILSPLKRFDLTDVKFKLVSHYPSEKSGGIFYDSKGTTEITRNVLDLKETYFNGLKEGKSFEIYPFGLDWKTIDEIHTAYVEKNDFNDFFRGLSIDLDNEDAFIYNDFAVEVYDVSSDFEQYEKSEEVKKHKPKIEKGSNGENKFATSEVDKIALFCYEVNGNVKAECIYKKQDPIPIDEMFVLNTDLFKNTKDVDKKKVDIAVTFHSKYNIRGLKDPDGLKRIDIITLPPEPNMNNQELNLFKWVNPKGLPNNALYESIKSTLEENTVRPPKRVIYSFYIKTLL